MKPFAGVSKPLLAATVKDPSKLRFPLLASPKLDGVRALVIDGEVYSRSFKLIPNLHVQKLFGKPQYNGFDGELIIGSPHAQDVFHKTMSGVMSVDGEPDAKFHVFDDFLFLGVFQQRLESVSKRSRGIGDIFPVGHWSMSSQEDIDTFEQTVLAQGYEGVMLRDPLGHYKEGRSTEKEQILLKVKRFVDAEAVIVGFTEAMHNTNEAQVNELGTKERSHKKEGMVGKNMLGSIKVVTKEGVDFEIGTGFTEAQRIEFWKDRKNLLGKLVKYRSQEIGVKDRPRFPVFHGFRDKIDL